MTEKRFTYLNTTGWNKDGFLNVMNGLNEKNKKLQKENLDLSEELDYYKTKCASLETGLFQADRENRQLKEENKELRQDNDIKFWKLQCLQSSNNNQIMLFELGRAIQQGYEVSDKFKQYLEEIKEHNKEIQEKHKRLFEYEEKELEEMAEKRFKLHIDWFNYDKTEGNATLSDNEQPLLETERVEDMRRVKELLNELHNVDEDMRRLLE